MICGKRMMYVGIVLLIAGLSLFAVRTMVVIQVCPVSVPVAIRDIEAGTRICAEDIDLITVSQRLLLENACCETKEVIGRTVRKDTFVPAGSLFYESQFETKKDHSNE